MSVVPAEIEIELVLHALLRELVEEAGPIRLGLPTGATPASAFAAAAERHPALAAHASTVAFATGGGCCAIAAPKSHSLSV